MTIAALVTEAREDLLNDTVEPYLWSDAQLTRYANEAVIEACNRTPLLRKTKTVSVIATTAAYALDSYTRQIYTLKLALGTSPLTQETEASMDIKYGYNWRNATGAPRHYIRTLYPVPVVNDTLTYTCSATPDSTFSLDTDMDATDQKGLLFWIAHKALLLPDPTIFNPIKSGDYLMMFNAEFGTPKTARYQRAVQDNPLYGTITGGRMC
jgi:hypothetical protein